MALGCGGRSEDICGGFLFGFRLPITRAVMWFLVLEALEDCKESREEQEQNKAVLLCLNCSPA